MKLSPAYIRRLQAEADAPHLRRDLVAYEKAVPTVQRDRALQPIDGNAPDRDLCELARRRADHIETLIVELCEPVTLQWLNDQVETLEARPMEYKKNAGPLDEQLQGFAKRAMCAHWWRRQLRRAAAYKREAQAQAAGRISVRTGQPYVTNDSVRRRDIRNERNRDMMEAAKLENSDGQIITLLQAVQAGTANLSIRRGELMTRIRGAEEWATAAGMVGIFTTNTLPSRFHSQRFKGGTNPKFDGSTVKAGQDWLCKTWARCRAKLHRQKIRVFGFRVAEPHHDGVPHWHMLLWVSADQADRLIAIIRAAWLADDGEEKGAQKYRFKANNIDPARGGAVAYVAKYIAKNIDDAGSVALEGHLNHKGEKLTGATAKRVMTWASAWNIRQFQAIGQPPVTVWRELRRVHATAAAGASDAMQAAHAAVNRADTRRACWRGYIDAQGGAMLGRGNRLALGMGEVQAKPGRYGTSYTAKIFGVVDKLREGETVLSDRREWRTAGTWAAADRTAAAGGMAAHRERLARPQAAQPWTRVNNCTGAKAGPSQKDKKQNEAARLWLIANGFEPMDQEQNGAGGPTENQKCPKNSTTQPKNWP